MPNPRPTAGNIFISYRREDSAAYAGRLCDYLNRLVGPERVFMDIEDIAPGQRFLKTIDDTIARCEIALIIVGPRWAEILRQRAQEAQKDFVCHEIESVLARQMTVVPVLVGGASIGGLAGLPEKLAPLSQFEVAELRDKTFNEDCLRMAESLGLQPVGPPKSPRNNSPKSKKLWFWAGAAIGLALVIAAGVGIARWNQNRILKATLDPIFATARLQAERGEFEAAFGTYQGLLKNDKMNRQAMDLQVDSAMNWLQDFRVVDSGATKAADVAALKLTEIMPVLDAGLARANAQGTRGADILAHIGWAHWLNERIAEREFGPAAEQHWQRALKVDPNNVFAHAMLGNWMMQRGASNGEALEHFRTAVEQKRARPFVRRLQLAVLIYPRDPQVRVALIRAADEMRRNGEPIEDRLRTRILSSYDPTVNNADELLTTLSAVPAAEAWATYQWLYRPGDSAFDYKKAQHDFVHASLLEIEHKVPEALTAFQTLKGELKTRGFDGRIAAYVDLAIKRLSTKGLG
jgi:tetratricopeptide (TPR) repeat protein